MTAPTADGRRPGVWQLSPLEQAAGLTFGREPGVAPLAPAAPGVTPRAAFEAVVREGLLRPPCVVSFSGGRDSSAVLAVAADLARREGHAPPVARTLVFPDVPSADESAWQQLVVDHIGVAHWERVPMTSEIDLLGPAAQRVFARHGVLWPCNTHFHEPMARAAAGGSLITGFGGDEIMSTGWPWERVNHVLTGQVRPRPADLLQLGAAHAPAPLRRAALRRKHDPVPPRPWLTPDAARAVARRRSDVAVAEPVRFDRNIQQSWWPSRYRRTTAASLGLLADGFGAKGLHPFADGRFLAAVAASRGRSPALSRTRAMVDLVGDLLPREILARASKAEFSGAFWGPECVRFAAGWEGAGVDPALVDVPTLQRMWRTRDYDGRTYPMLQAAWVATHGTNATALTPPR